MRQVPAFQSFNPVGDINTTPLIDVLLVLLVIFIITIPVEDHIVKVDLPSNRLPKYPVRSDVNLIAIAADGMVSWNGVPATDADLRLELGSSRLMRPTPELHLRPDAEARHGRVDEILAVIECEGITRFGFVGNERYANIF